jgi:SAM-dependent methyltransferase
LKIDPYLYDNIGDVDIRKMFSLWDEPRGCRVLEIGCYDESVAAARMLSILGYKVTGVDLRPSFNPIPNYRHVQADFCDPPVEFFRESLSNFDVAYSISALEHFGLGTYGEGHPNLIYDSTASRQCWNLLREGGVFYLTVPYGAEYRIAFPDWRVYNLPTVQSYLVQDFTLDHTRYFFSAPGMLGGVLRNPPEEISQEEADRYSGDPPHLTVLLKLRKISKKRLSSEKEKS